MPIIYDEFRSYFESNKDKEYIVKMSNKYGYVDTKGQMMIPTVYDDLGFLKGGKITFFKQNDKYGFIDRNNKIVVSAKYDEAGLFYQGLATVKLNGKYGFVDETGKVVIPLIYEDAYGFDTDYGDGKGHVKLNGKEFKINKKGERIK